MAKHQSKAADLGAVIKAHRDAQESIVHESGPAEPPKLQAKSRDAGYVKLTAYVPRELHMSMKIALIRQGREMSHLIAELVADWLKREEER